MKALYKYPQAAFPYTQLVEENGRRGLKDPEFELADTGAFAEDRYFDVVVEYAKAGPDDLLIRITVHNRGPDPSTLHLLPTVWFRNTWSWGCKHEGCTLKPRMVLEATDRLHLTHETLGDLSVQIGLGPDGDSPPLLFTDNETNNDLIFGSLNISPYVKDAFHRFLIQGDTAAVNPDQTGTKAAAHYVLQLPAGESQQVCLRVTVGAADPLSVTGAGFDDVFEARIREADAFYDSILPSAIPSADRAVARQAYAGLLWNK